ncbi:MAG: MerR family transcriptional regulator [Chloroflexi bacterium]|nr:MerR family transcriptional regulator [Chloroflexota bacterium]
MPDDLKTIQQAASELGVTQSTLKRWAKEFTQFLSPSPVSGDGAGRRFTDNDLAILRGVREQLAGGLSTDEVLAQFQSEGRAETSALALSPRDGAGGGLASPGFAVLTDTLRAMIENQQAIQNSLQVNRNLQGVLIQDNFNLKEENMNLRERMQRMEQELSDLRKRDADHRLMLEQRLARLEQEMRKGFKLF